MENKIPETVIIIGGGVSIQEGIEKDLWNKIKNKFTIGCNSCFKHFVPTLLSYVDERFMKKYYKELYNLPLVVGNKISNFKVDNKTVPMVDTNNLFMLQASGEYHSKNAIKKNKIFSGVLVGLYATTLAIALGVKEIYYLGFDWTRKKDTNEKDYLKRTITHYYQNEENLNHPGMGKTVYYDGHKPETLFDKYIKEDINIYNVSPNSNINCFTKITYDQFFLILNNIPNYNQDKLREIIKTEIKLQKKEI